MDTLLKSILLFLLNLLDAQLTIIWMRNGVAREGNALMAYLLEAGSAPFLFAKIVIGAFAAITLYSFSHRRAARGGLEFALGAYLLLMAVHVATILSALI